MENNSSTVLLRRPLPSTKSTDSNRKQVDSRVRTAKSQDERSDGNELIKENVEKYWNSDVNLESNAYHPPFHYSSHDHARDFYFYRPRGPNPFPRRNPRRLPRLQKKSRRGTESCSNISNEFLSYYKLDLVAADLACDSSKRQIDYSYSNTEEEVRHNVSKEEEEVTNANEETGFKMREKIYAVPAEEELEEKSAWKQILLEHQLLEIDRLLNEREERPHRIDDTFRSDTHLRQRKVEEEVDELSPRINSFIVEKPSIDEMLLIRSYKEITESSRELKEDTRVRASSPHKKTILDLKACFLDYLPLIDSNLIHNLTTVNLSFNYFTTVPEQLYGMSNLISLNMRNNPLSALPDEIRKMEKLRYLNLSFCKLTDVNINVFSLAKLESLDLSYNLLTSIHEDVDKLSALTELSVDGNFIGVFPRTIINLNLYSFSCNSNFTSGLFWKENCPHAPQKLVDVAMVTLVKNDLLIRVPDTIQEKLLLGSKCPYCNAFIAGEGVRALKPAMELFGIKNLPLMFHVCSQTCKMKLQRSKELPLLDL